MEGKELCCKARDKCQTMSKGKGYKWNAIDIFPKEFLDDTCGISTDWCAFTDCGHGAGYVKKDGFMQSCECLCDVGYDCKKCDECATGYKRARDGSCKSIGYWLVEGGEVALSHWGNLSLGVGGHEPGVWHVIADSRGATLHDVSQGRLGTCYLLAAMASVAYHQPAAIDKMFDIKMRHYWKEKNPAYVTNWILDGMPTTVAVSEELPVNPKTGRPFFTDYNNGADFWPVILEKSWAKIFGSYRSINGGYPGYALAAMTGAPLDQLSWKDTYSEADKISVWNTIVDGFSSFFPMTAFTVKSRKLTFDVAQGHAFAVLGATELRDFGRAVYLYNPWAKSKYNGALPNVMQKDGRFHMTLDEFMASFAVLDVALARSHYEVSALGIPVSSQINAASFTMQNSEPFYVQLHWPETNLLNGCDRLKPRITFALVKVSADQNGALISTTPEFAKWDRRKNFGRIDMPGGSGTYTVFVIGGFEGKENWLKEMRLTVYAAESVKVTSASRAVAMKSFLQTFGLCEAIDVKDEGSFKIDPKNSVNGLPTFALVRSHRVMYWSIARDWTSGWKIAKSLAWAAKDFSAHVSCANASANLDTIGDETEKGELVDSQCSELLRRLDGLNNYMDITGSGTDPLFPPTLASISKAGENCGDTAADIHGSCEKYNNWGTFSGVMKAEGKYATDFETCIETTPATRGKCRIVNNCQEGIIMQCLREDGRVRHSKELIYNTPLYYREDTEFCACVLPPRLELKMA